MNRALQHRLTCRFLWASLLFIGGSVWAQDNKPMIVITPQEVCDYCDTLVDATFDLTGERLYVAARGKNQDGDVYPWLSLWDITRTNQTQATMIVNSKSPVQDDGDFMIKSDPLGELMGVAGHTMKLWYAKVSNGTLPYLATLTKGSSQIHAFVFSHKGDKIAVSVDDNNLSLWDTFKVKTGDLSVAAKAKTNGHAITIRFHPAKLYYLDGIDGGDTEIWDYSQLTNGSPKHLVSLSSDDHDIVIDHSGGRVVTTDMDYVGYAVLWNMNEVLNGNTTPIAKMQHSDDVFSINFDTTERYIVTASDDKTAKLWDSSQIKNSVPLLVCTMQHKCGVRLALFAPGKNRILTTSTCEIKLWDTQTVKEDGKATLLNTFDTDGSYQKIQLDPAGIWLLTVNDKSVQLWDIASLQPDQEPPTSETDYSE